jgi:hypothetical protein
MNRNTANRIAITSAIAAVLLLCAYATGEHRQTVAPPECVATAQAIPTNDAETPSVAEARPPDEADATAEGVSGGSDEAALSEDENKVRDTARDFVKKAYPHSKTDGVFLLGFCAGDLYLAGVDTTIGNSSDQRKTVDLLVRRYVRKNGNSYWRAEPLTPEQSAKYHVVALGPCEQ